MSKNQFVEGIEGKVVTSKQNQADDEGKKRGQEDGYMQRRVDEVQVCQQLEPGRGRGIGGVGICNALQVELNGSANGATQQSKNGDVGTRAGEGNGQGRGEEDGGAQGHRYFCPHQCLAEAEHGGQEADKRERDSTSTHNQDDDGSEIEGCWQGLPTLPGEDPEDGELGGGEEEAEENEAM